MQASHSPVQNLNSFINLKGRLAFVATAAPVQSVQAKTSIDVFDIRNIKQKKPKIAILLKYAQYVQNVQLLCKTVAVFPGQFLVVFFRNKSYFPKFRQSACYKPNTVKGKNNKRFATKETKEAFKCATQTNFFFTTEQTDK